MLTLTDSRFDRRPSLFGRRDFLRIGSLCGLTLPGLLAAKAQAATAKKGYKNKSVVFLFLQGGPPQIETFDPKLGVPDDIRSCTGEIQTNVPGVWFGGTNHHGSLTPLLLAGGGLKMGQAIGSSDRIGARPATKPYGPENLLATVLHTLFDAAEIRISPDLVPTEVAKTIFSGQPIEDLF